MGTTLLLQSVRGHTWAEKWLDHVIINWPTRYSILYRIHRNIVELSFQMLELIGRFAFLGTVCSCFKYSVSQCTNTWELDCMKYFIIWKPTCFVGYIWDAWKVSDLNVWCLYDSGEVRRGGRKTFCPARKFVKHDSIQNLCVQNDRTILWIWILQLEITVTE